MSLMDLMSTRLPLILSSSSIPKDIKFLFKEEGVVTSIMAHKIILAVISDVFEKQFFGSLKEPEHEILIKDAKREVFEVLIDFIYNKQPIMSDFDLYFLSSLFYLAEKYDISALKKEIIATIINKEISDENVLNVAIIAEESIVLEEFSDNLYDRVAMFLLKKFAGQLSNVFEFFSHVEATQVNGLVLLKVMARMKNMTPLLCINKNVSAGAYTGPGPIGLVGRGLVQGPAAEAEIGATWEYWQSSTGTCSGNNDVGGVAVRAGFKFGAGFRRGVPQVDLGPVPCDLSPVSCPIM